MIPIRFVHTLGPSGTNSEKAALEWRRWNGILCEIALHETIDVALDAVFARPKESALIACIVYPRLHEVVFQNLHRLRITGCFMCTTHRMLLAQRTPDQVVNTIAAHPATKDLLSGLPFDIKWATSNVTAAKMCREGTVDACITTEAGLNEFHLIKVRDFGEVPMGFSIHQPIIDQ